VAFIGVLPCDFTCSSKLKALFCTGVGFSFWHIRYLLLLIAAFLNALSSFAHLRIHASAHFKNLIF